MACNSCAKSFSFLRKEKGCPGCGFSYCPQCLCKKVFLQKINSEAKVCLRCSKDNTTSKSNTFEAPNAYYKRLLASRQHEQGNSGTGNQGDNPKDKLIQEKLQKLKEKVASTTTVTEDEISNRLKNIKDQPTATDDEISERLAKLRGLPNIKQTEPSIPKPDLRTEQEQADDLLKQFIVQTNIDAKYKDEFDYLVEDMESRLQKLRGTVSGVTGEASNQQPDKGSESEDDETAVNRIIKKLKIEGDTNEALEVDDNIPCSGEELPFCEICNEDAILRCLGCKYLFCKQCYNEHKDDDDGCDKYEVYTAPKHS